MYGGLLPALLAFRLALAVDNHTSALYQTLTHSMDA